MSHRPTLEDVAREAGCSRSTVSYVILRTKPISREVSERVKSAIGKLGYRPYRTRRRPEVRKIALIASPDPSMRLLQLFAEELLSRSIGCQPVILPGKEVLDENGMAILSGLNENPGIAGIINTHPRITTLDLLARCKSKPCVIYNREGSILSKCHMSHYAIGAWAAQRCQQLGYPKIGVFLEELQRVSQAYLNEYNAFTETLALHGGPECSFGWLKKNADNAAKIIRHLKSWYKNGIRLFFCWNSQSSIVITQWAYREKLRIPEDLSLLSIDTNDRCAMTSPPVTALVPPEEELVRGAVDDLLARMEERELPEQDLSPVWIERSSTKCGGEGKPF